MKVNQQGGFKINSISIIDSRFKRINSIDNKKDIINDIDIAVSNKCGKVKAECSLTLTCAISYKEGKRIADSEITALGVFSKTKGTTLKVKDFAKINAYAIMYPFVREHLASLSLKAGIKVVMLPSINFVALAVEKEMED